MKYEVLNYGHPTLREQAEPVEAVDDGIRELARDMLETMYAESGVGLAAQQIGKTVAICVVDVPAQLDVEEEDGPRLNPDIAMPLVLINPEIVDSGGGTETGREGCLSFPEIQLEVERPIETVVRYTDAEGKEQTIRVTHFVSRVIQHEIDHLNAALFIDRISPVRRLGIAGQLKRMKRETAAALAAS